MTAELVRYEREGTVATVTLDNPPLNIITAPVRERYMQTLARVRDEEGLRAVVLTGAGDRAFCAGADLEEEAALDSDTVGRFIAEDRAVYDATQQLPVPVIAAVNGHCMGGGFELALACDIRIASTQARFRGAGVRVGLIASTARLTRLVGVAAAKDVLLTGRTFDGEEAVRLGIAGVATEPDELLPEAQRWADMIAARAPLAVRRTKQAIEAAGDVSFAEALAVELEHFAYLTTTEDHKAALAAFFKREPPEFHGR
jgi:enoyl-CoA hydratase